MDKELVQALKNCGAVKSGDFTLASGKKSTYYVDIKKAITDPATLELIARRITAVIEERHIRAEVIGGVAVGGIPLATAVSLKTGLPLTIVRKSLKEYGTGGRFIGDVAGRQLLMLEDVTTTGGSVIEAIKDLRDAGSFVNMVITVVDRDEGATSALKDIGVEMLALVRASDLLQSK